MADGLDVLLGGAAPASAPASGLDALMGAAPVAQLAKPVNPAVQNSTGMGGVVQGVRDTQNGAAQWLYNLLPKSVQSAGDSADHWLYDKTDGAVGTKPGLDFNNAVAAQNQQYESTRPTGGGVDWARALSGGATQAAAGLAAGVPAMGAVGAGVLGGTLMPATDLQPGSNSGDFAKQKAMDIATGGVGGKVIGTIGGALASAVKPEVSKLAQLLMDQGIKLTPGQMLGGAAKATEDKLVSVPIVGDMIRGAQGRSVEGLNTAAYSRVLDPLKEAGFDTSAPKTAGRESIDSITQQVKDAYNSIIPKLTFKVDPQFSSEFQSLQKMAQQGLAPPQAATFERIVQNNFTGNLTAQGNASGKTLQGMMSDIGKAADGYSHDASFEGRQLGDALKTLQQSIQDGLKRMNPQQAAQLSKVDEAFANLARVQTAAATQGAPNGVFTAAQLASAVKGGDKTVRDNAYARGQALMQDLSDPAKSVLSSAAPNSGTADRAMTAGAMGALLSNPLQLLNPAVLSGMVPALAYTKTGGGVAQSLLANRPEGAQALADLLRKGTANGIQPATPALVKLLQEQVR